MPKASLRTIFLTVFLDLLGFGLVVPFLPGVARQLGASNFQSGLVAAVYSVMQFLFVPFWGRLSDRHGRRPILLISIAASALGMVMLGLAGTLPLLILARAWSGFGTANIAVAQAYIADITTPENRARGMGIIGMSFGLGFIFGPFIGGMLGEYSLGGRQGALAAFFAAGLSLLNLILCWRFVPESLPPERRGLAARKTSPLDWGALREVTRMPGIGLAVILGFLMTFFFSGMETTFRLFTEDAFGMTVKATGWVFAFVGIVAATVQGGLIAKLTKRFGEVTLLRAGQLALAVGFVGVALAAGAGRLALFAASGFIALGSGLFTPSLSSYASRRASAGNQGLVLGALQSLGALARVAGPIGGAALYQYIGIRAPYLAGAVGFIAGLGLSGWLSPLETPVLQRASATSDK